MNDFLLLSVLMSFAVYQYEKIIIKPLNNSQMTIKSNKNTILLLKIQQSRVFLKDKIIILLLKSTINKSKSTIKILYLLAFLLIYIRGVGYTCVLYQKSSNPSRTFHIVHLLCLFQDFPSNHFSSWTVIIICIPQESIFRDYCVIK